MKTCTKCKVEKDESMFFKTKYNKSGLASWCRLCTQEGKNKWRIENREKYLNSTKSYNKKRMSNTILRKKDYKSKAVWGQKPKGRYSLIKAQAKTRGYEFNLTKDEFMNYWGKECYYCGISMHGVGLDRKDNSRLYDRKMCVMLQKLQHN